VLAVEVLAAVAAVLVVMYLDLKRLLQELH